MATYYAEKERKNALRQMHIDPNAERVNSAQAARILSWRAKEEHHVEIAYNATSVRAHSNQLDAQPAQKSDGSINPRQNTYSVKKLFEIDIVPSRTNKSRRNEFLKNPDNLPRRY